jgi:hypothetical protein
MGYVKTADELAKIYRETFDFFDAEMLTVVWDEAGNRQTAPSPSAQARKKADRPCFCGQLSPD